MKQPSRIQSRGVDAVHNYIAGGWKKVRFIPSCVHLRVAWSEFVWIFSKIKGGSMMVHEGWKRRSLGLVVGHTKLVI